MKKNMNNVGREIEILNSKVRMAILQMRSYNGNSDAAYFSHITPVLNKAFDLFELGWGTELWSKPYIRGMMSAAFKHAVADIARNTYIYDPDRVAYEEYLEWIEEEECKLEALNLDKFSEWSEAMRSYVDYAGGLAPGHHQIHAEIERLIRN